LGFSAEFRRLRLHIQKQLPRDRFSRTIRLRHLEVWGNQADESYKPDWATYKNNSGVLVAAE
jgi:hypothetical protein